MSDDVDEVQAEALNSLQDMTLWRGMHYDRKGREISPWDMMQLKHPRDHKDMDYSRISDTWIGNIRVSTVWLGMNHQWDDTKPPLIFETMIFVNDLYLDDDDPTHVDHPLDRAQWQYSTRRQAEIGHRQVVRLVRLFERRRLPLAKRHKTRNRHWRG